MSKVWNFINNKIVVTVSWLAVLFCVIYFDIPNKLNFIPSNWYLFGTIIVGFLILIIYYKSYNMWKKLNAISFTTIGIVFSIGMFLCFLSPNVGLYNETDIARTLNTFTAFGPLVIGFATVLFACKQSETQNKQHSLALFEKRWDFIKKFEEYAKNMDDCIDTENQEKEVVFNIAEDFLAFSKQSDILFNKSIADDLRKLSDSAKERYMADVGAVIYENKEKEENKSYKKEIENANNICGDKIEKYITQSKKVYNHMMDFLRKEHSNEK